MKLVNKVNSIDTSGFLLKTRYDKDKLELETKIPNTSNFVKKIDYNTNVTEIEGKIPSITGSATTSALTIVENKIPSIKNLVKKTDYDTKLSEIEKKLTDQTTEFNKLKLAQADLVTKTDFNSKYSILKRKIVLNKTRNVLNEKELKKLKAFHLGYFTGKRYLDEDGAQNYLAFHSILKYFTWITKWTSKFLSNESLEVVSASDHTLNPSINYYGEKVRLKFNGSVLQQKIVTYNQKKVVNLYVVFEITSFHDIDNYPTLTNALFGAVKLIKNADIDKYKYSGYGDRV